MAVEKKVPLQFTVVQRPSHTVVSDTIKKADAESLICVILKGEDSAKKASKQKSRYGRQSLPFDPTRVKALRNYNIHHSTSISTKVACTVGIGFEDDPKAKADKAAKAAEKNPQPASAPGMPPKDPTAPPLPNDPAALAQTLHERSLSRTELSKAERLLNPLCTVSILDVLTSMASDYWEVGFSYMEVVRDDADKITGLHYLRAEQVRIFEESASDYHFEVATDNGTQVKFCRFGDKADFLTRSHGSGLKAEDVSEVIMWRQAPTKHRWYPHPSWIAAVPTIEVQQMVTQDTFDFFQNRGVPEFMLFLTKGSVDSKEFNTLKASLQAGIGLRNSHKSAIVNIADPNIEVQLEKLALETQNAPGASELATNNAIDIVSAHQVPPLLAGIVVPGKMSAANELPNALLGFQSLVIGPAQRSLWTVLSQTLGGSEGVRGLNAGDLRLRAITDEFDMGKVDTTARMKQPVAEAQVQGRNPADGLKQ